MRGGIGLFAQRTFGQARPGLSWSDELTGELDQVGRYVDRSASVFECWRLAECDLFIEGLAFGFVVRILRPELVRSRMSVTESDLICVIEPDGEAGMGDGAVGEERTSDFPGLAPDGVEPDAGVRFH